MKVSKINLKLVRPSGKGDREAIVVGAGLCHGEGEHEYTVLAPH